MNGASAAMLVVLGLSAPPRTPDLQVEVITAAGAALPELAEAVARALVVGGARVVLRGPTSGPCESCGEVRVIEMKPGMCRVEVRHEQYAAATTLHLPLASSLFDQARAIAIQAHLLMPWQAAARSKTKEAAGPLARSPAARTKHDHRARPHALPIATSKAEPSVSLVPGNAPTTDVPPALVPLPTPPRAEAERLGSVVEVQPRVVPPSRVDSKPLGGTGESALLARSATRRDESSPASRYAGTRESRVRTAVAQSPDEARVLPAEGLVTPRTAAPKPQWPWIPTAIGASAAGAAAVCAVVARGHYNALSDQSQTYDSARAHKSAGEHWQTASWVLSGAAVVGVATGIVGFARRSSGGSSTATTASPVPGGGIITVAGNFP